MSDLKAHNIKIYKCVMTKYRNSKIGKTRTVYMLNKFIFKNSKTLQENLL